MLKDQVCLVILHLASTSCRKIDQHHDRRENGQIAQFLIPLLGSDVKDDLEVEVVPYRDYKHNKKIHKSHLHQKPVAGNGSALETKKKDSPLAVILANDKSKKSPSTKENADGRRFLKMPFWESAESKLGEDNSRSDGTIIIHVKRKKVNGTKSKKARVQPNKHEVVSKEVEETISENSDSNEHVLIQYDDKLDNDDNFAVNSKKIHNKHPYLYHAEILDSSKETRHFKQKKHDKHNEHKTNGHQNIMKVVPKDESTMHYYYEENDIINGTTETIPDTAYNTESNLSYTQETLGSKSSEEFENSRIIYKNKEIFNTSSNEDSFSKTEESHYDDNLHDTHKIYVKPDVIVSTSVDGSNHTNDKLHKLSEEESIIESDSSVIKESDEFDNLHNDIQVQNSTIFDKHSSSQDIEVEQNSGPFHEVTHKYQNKDNSKIDKNFVDISASSDKIIKEIYHPNLHFEPYLIHKTPQKEKTLYPKSLIEVADVSTNEALMKAYALLFDTNNSDDKYESELTPKHSKINLQKGKNVKLVSSPEYVHSSEKIIHHFNEDKSSEEIVLAKDTNHSHDLAKLEYSKYLSENLTTSEEDNISSNQIIQRGNVDDYGVNMIEYDTSRPSNEYTFSPEYIIGESEREAENSESSEDSKVSNTSTVEVNLKNHTLPGPEVVLLSGGKIIKYEAPKNIKVVEKKYNQNEGTEDSGINIRNAGVHQFEINDNESKTSEGENSDGNTQALNIAGVKVCQKDSNSDENSIYKTNVLNLFRGNMKKKYVNIIKDKNSQKQIPVIPPRDIKNIENFNKQIDAIASFVKKNTLLEAKHDSGCKSYNLSFLFNKR